MNANSKPKAPNSKISVREWLDQATHTLQQAGVPSASLDAQLLLSDALEVDRTWLLAHDQALIAPQTAQIALQRRAARMPLAYLRGWQEFYGRRFIVSPEVLIPRPESETLIAFLKSIPTAKLQGNLFDVGTGSGCLGITAGLEFPQLHITLIDISQGALTIAKQNAQRHALPSQRLTLLNSDLLAATSRQPSIIVANLPYVDKTWDRSPETAHEPAQALYADNHGLALIYRLITQAARQLPPGAYLLLEADTRQIEAITSFAATYQFVPQLQEGFCIMLQKH